MSGRQRPQVAQANRDRRRPALSRFLEKIRVQGCRDCWIWAAGRNKGGYGTFRDENGRSVLAHVWAYQQFIGPVPDGLTLDHFRCDTPPCVNPWHVRPATQRENVLRGSGPAAINAAKTHCKRGHEFTPENTRVSSDGHRRCRACRVIPR